MNDSTIDPASESAFASAPRDHASAPRFGTARGRVETVHNARRLVVRLDGRGLVEVEPALTGYDAPRVGDRLLVTRDDDGRHYAIGLLRPSPLDEMLDATEELRSEQATVEPVIRVEDKRGRLIFEYDPGSDVATLHAPTGDLRLTVPEGALRIDARDGVSVETEADVSLKAGRSMTFATKSGELGSKVELRPEGVTVVGQTLSAAADRAETMARAIGITAQQIDLHADRVKRVVGVLDTQAVRVVERARDVYREVERLSQTRAGTLRLVAQKAASLVGQDTLIRARDRAKITAERIHLA